MTREPLNFSYNIKHNEPYFHCTHCGEAVSNQITGSEHRNHCPYCLWSRHVDMVTGDRRSGCKGEMAPIGISVQRNGEWSLIHRCSTCGMLRVNRIAADDNEMLLLSLAVRPLSAPPFPLDRLPARNSNSAH